MIKIPQNNRLSIPNTSDLAGNLWYTKNMNLDEEGYIKLSSRAVCIEASFNNSNFGLATSFGRNSQAGFLLPTSGNEWIFDVDVTGIDSQEDTDTPPSTTFDSWGTWWQNRWYVTANTSLWYKSGSSWTNTSVSLTGNKSHPVEQFRTGNTLCIGNGNIVVQIDNLHSTANETQLTLPSGYEVVGLSYSGNRMAIITILSDSATYQNQEAYLFVWDGVSDEYQIGIPCGSDQIVAVTAYQSTWVILTRSGQLKSYNGGGFNDLASLEYYYQSLQLGDSSNLDFLGTTMQVEGDVLYMNVSNNLNAFGKNQERFIENFNAGILCYDPKIGIYHKYSPSISMATSDFVNISGVNTTDNTLTIQNAAPITGSQVILRGSAPTGTYTDTLYYVIKVSSHVIKLAATYDDAVALHEIDLITTNSELIYTFFLVVKDFGQTFVPGKAGAVGAVSNNFNSGANHLFFANQVEQHTGTGTDYVASFTADFYENRGYLVTPKIVSNNVTDVWQKVYIRHRPLSGADKIILKMKDREITGIPVTTTQNLYDCVATYTSTTVMTTTANFAEAYAYFQSDGELECEIISGSGAGCMEKVIGMSFDGTTYTVTVENSITGAVATERCNFILNNYSYLGEITPDNQSSDGYYEIPITSNSSWIKLKAELRGVETTIQELNIINKNYKPAL